VTSSPKDPIKENGGVNLYAMVGNRVINGWDWLGFGKFHIKFLPTNIANRIGGVPNRAAYSVQYIKDKSDNCKCGTIVIVQYISSAGYDNKKNSWLPFSKLKFDNANTSQKETRTHKYKGKVITRVNAYTDPYIPDNRIIEDKNGNRHSNPIKHGYRLKNYKETGGYIDSPIYGNSKRKYELEVTAYCREKKNSDRRLKTATFHFIRNQEEAAGSSINNSTDTEEHATYDKYLIL
jgi:hypothetical protein